MSNYIVYMKSFFYFLNTKNNNKEFRNIMKHFKVEYQQKKINLFGGSCTFIKIIEPKDEFFWRLVGLKCQLFSFQIFVVHDTLIHPDLVDTTIETIKDNDTSLIETDKDDEILSIETDQDDDTLSMETNQDDDTYTN